MAAFIAVAGTLLLVAMGMVVFGPRWQRRRTGVSRAAVNAEVLRQQLNEIERDQARGLLDATEFERARDELRRRLLAEAAPRERALRLSGGSPQTALIAVAAVLPLAAIVLYAHFGQPRLVVGSAFDVRSVSTASPTNNDRLLPQLEARVAEAPNDARAWVLLARVRMQRDQFEPAADAYARAIDASATVARDPLIWCEYADALGMAAGGRLAGRPRELIDKALALDPAHPRALEMAGSAAYEANDFSVAVRHWQQLLAQLPADSAEHLQLAAAIARAERRAQFTLPPS